MISSCTEDVGDFVSYNFKPQLKTVGPKYGKQLGEIRAALSELDGTKAKAELDENSKLSFDFASGKVELFADDLLIETKQKEGFFTLTDNGITVAIDTVLTEELIKEGFVREIVSKIQTMRKDADFNVTDHIRVTIEGSKNVVDIALEKSEEIVGDTLCVSLTATSPVGFVKEWDINGEALTIGIERI